MRFMRVINTLGICLAVFAVFIIAAPVTSHGAAMDSEVEILPLKDSYAEITDVTVHQLGKDLLVSGTIVKTGRLFTSYTGHIDVAVTTPEGGFKHGTAEYRAFPSRNRTSAFEIRIPNVSAAGAEVRMAFHPRDDANATHSFALCMLRNPGATASSCS